MCMKNTKKNSLIISNGGQEEIACSLWWKGFVEKERSVGVKERSDGCKCGNWRWRRANMCKKTWINKNFSHGGDIANLGLAPSPMFWLLELELTDCVWLWLGAWHQWSSPSFLEKMLSFRRTILSILANTCAQYTTMQENVAFLREKNPLLRRSTAPEVLPHLASWSCPFPEMK